jgi:L-fuconolactonase
MFKCGYDLRMRIDAHQHFWDLNLLDYYWMPPGESVLRRNYLPEDLWPILEENRFDGSVLVQANRVMRETHWLLELASANAFILGVVAWVDLTDPDLPHVLDGLQNNPKFKGVRHLVHDEPDPEWLLRPEVLRGLRELARRGIPYDLLLRPVHLPMIPRVATEVPGLPMVIDHIAKPLIAAQKMDGWAEDIAVASKIPGLHCKLSGMITEADPGNVTADALRPYVQHVLSLFEPERLMFGSDWPVCKLAGSWKTVLALFTQAIGAQTIEVREQILGETARRFYKL